MQEKTKKIEVCFGSSSISNLGKNFKFLHASEELFREIASFKGNGGNFRQILGDFDGILDNLAYKMEFCCTPNDFYVILSKIRETFNNYKLEGVEFVSIKAYDVESYSFRVDK